MNFRYIVFLLLGVTMVTSCAKNEMSNIPQITFLSIDPTLSYTKPDTAVLLFSIDDGDADLGNAAASGKFDIYMKDLRFDSAGFTGYYFPVLNTAALDPKKGVTARCTYIFYNYMLSPRTDSVHSKGSDTTRFDLYIVDKAGHQSNHIITDYIVISK